MLSSEDAYAASFALLQTLSVANGGNFKNVSRRLRHVEDVDLSQMPAVYQLQRTRGMDKSTFQGIAVWSLVAHWYIYVAAPNMEAPTTPLLNPRVDEVLALLPSDPEQAAKVTVNGNAVILMLDGPAEFFEGLLDVKSVARIPIRIILPN